MTYSKSLQQAGSNTTILREVSPEQVHELKAQPGGDRCLGGARFGNGVVLLRHARAAA